VQLLGTARHPRGNRDGKVFALLGERTATPRLHDRQRQVHGRAVEIAPRILQEVTWPLALQQSKENRLDHVFRVFHAAGDAIGCSVDQDVVLLEDLVEFLREGLAGHSGHARHVHVRLSIETSGPRIC
jgi:hypothetical protein